MTEVIRQCVVSRDRLDKRRLLRLVQAPDGRPAFDPRAKAPGRGLYVRPDALASLLTSKTLSRRWPKPMAPLSETESRTFIDGVRLDLERRILEVLGLSRRSGELVVGTDQVVAALGTGGVGLVLLATDLADRTRAAVLQVVPEGVTVQTVFQKRQIGAALGRDEIGVAAVRQGVFSKGLLLDLERHGELRTDGV